MTEQEIQQATAEIKKAHDVLSQLCSNPASFTMSIPARPEKDTDLLIARGLDWADKLLAAAQLPAQGEPIPYRDPQPLLAALERAGTDDARRVVREWREGK